ncbi:HNH endonuclease [Paenibacillus albicereus]|uniref:Putative HNH nuclease YajD n=1 Tax=Paenibacillus albicereus TaxID=2726185 RepID=A0A6H2H053_9BACL|nr:HNH endonuclease signature motif containing protein [Paenibacillus albicereus]QJC52796.1 HNH endonuclease [Paenibacillus albicereus]
MPSKLKKPCAKAGCPELTAERHCTAHASKTHKRYDDLRESAAKRGYDARWRERRVRFLQQHPICLECYMEERLTPATVVDHIIPHKGKKKLFWDENNWQPLCKRHHDIKTVTEDGGFGRGMGVRREKRALDLGFVEKSNRVE